MVSALEYKPSVLSSIHSSSELVSVHYVDRESDGHCVLEMCLIHKSHDLAYLGQYGLLIKALNKSNIYMSPMRSVSYIDCH